MTRDEIVKELKGLVSRIDDTQHVVLLKCNGCHYTDEVTPSRAKRAAESQRGYYCDRCVSFMKGHKKTLLRSFRERFPGEFDISSEDPT
jgi:hypothetical protein